MKLRLWMCLLSLYGAEARALAPNQPLSGRLFYTPAQRAMLANARIHQVTDVPKTHAPHDPIVESAPVSFDGVITRSDGVSATHWINGRPHAGQPATNVQRLKPGQTRANNQVYESYQLVRPSQPVVTPHQAINPLINREATP
jgi:hypothetical protein